jgi:hypothetical protein
LRGVENRFAHAAAVAGPFDVYSHVIVPDEVDPETLKVLVSGADAALEHAPRDAPVMHRDIS